MPHAKLQAYMDATVLTLVDGREQVTTALQMIATALGRKTDPQPIQLLALRRYLRIGGRAIKENWAWTEEEARSRATQEPTKSLYAEAKKAMVIFAEKNPGYSLTVTPFRSLERQIALWNQNTTVQQAGADLARRMTEQVEEPRYPDPPAGAAVAMFRDRLHNAPVSPEPSNGAPGTSNHGRGVAVDFQVLKGRTVVADILTAQIPSVWKKGGWEAKLISACAGTKLNGPLKKPYEPWHWEYQP